MKSVKGLKILGLRVVGMAAAGALVVTASCRTVRPGKVTHISMRELSEFIGSDRHPVSQPVVLDFFFNSCEACEQNEPDLEKLVEELSGVAIFAAVSTDCDAGEVRKWRDKFPQASYQIIDDCNAQNRLVKLFEVEGYPTTVVIDRNGNVVEKTLGLLSLINLDLVHFTTHSNSDSIKAAVVRAYTRGVTED